MFYVLVFIVGATFTIDSSSAQDNSRVKNILELVQQALKIPKQRPKPYTSAEDSSITDNDNNSHYGSLKSNEIISLIQEASENYEKTTIQPHMHSDRFKGKAYDILLKKLLKKMYNTQSEPFNKVHEKHLSPNKLLVSSSEFENDQVRPEAVGNLEDYSKIYIILNPEAVQKSQNKNTIEDLVSKIQSISSSVSQNERQKEDPEGYYKGFPVKKELFLRRAMRDSKETFVPKESNEDYKKKRSRNDRGGGGGGGGRTAIPYIRQRGDIYERDN